MSTLIIRDLEASTELDTQAMGRVFGGMALPLFGLSNTVLDFDFAQAFNVGTVATNASQIDAAQGNVNGNGTQHADQYIDVYGDAYANTSNIGNIDVRMP